jgi:hypothetical protein
MQDREEAKKAMDRVYQCKTFSQAKAQMLENIASRLKRSTDEAEYMAVSRLHSDVFVHPFQDDAEEGPELLSAEDDTQAT